MLWLPLHPLTSGNNNNTQYNTFAAGPPSLYGSRTFHFDFSTRQQSATVAAANQTLTRPSGLHADQSTDPTLENQFEPAFPLDVPTLSCLVLDILLLQKSAFSADFPSLLSESRSRRERKLAFCCGRSLLPTNLPPPPTTYHLPPSKLPPAHHHPVGQILSGSQERERERERAYGSPTFSTLA